MFYAHSRNDSGRRQELVEHLRGVAGLAEQFSAAFGAAEAGHFLGLWHDIGKFNPLWQRYLLDSEAGAAKRGRGPDHKAAGTFLATRYLGLGSLCVQGHHGGLRTVAEVQGWLKERSRDSGFAEALERARRAVADLEPSNALPWPEYVRADRIAAELFVRFLFSALVDADFLDTERHTRQDASVARAVGLTMAELWTRFQADQAGATWNARRSGSDVVGRVRAEIYHNCLDAAELEPGLFRLSAPTGGGKTRSGMAFALRHAARHGQQRVIVAVPYTTITEQAADVYRRIFGDDEQGRPAVLEHHSGADRADQPSDDFDPGVNWSRLAAENWDAPIVVTTTVQLFESLFSQKTSRARRVHRLANSVIILDEAQALPPHLLVPILSALRELCSHYHTSVLISTATQPAFEAIADFRTLNAREIVRDSARLFAALRRVTYDWRADEPVGWPEAAQMMGEEVQALAVLNTKRDALALLDALQDPQALHLSTLLCGAHRREVVKEVRRRLASGEPCRVVSTQVVEAGVDLDFPLVLRAVGPLDSIIQAAGRCNREGRRDTGRVIVFRPADGGTPPGAYQVGCAVTERLLNEGILDPDHPQASRRYFELLYQTLDTDREKIQQLRAEFDFPEVGRIFRMIDDDTESIAVSYGSDEEQQRLQDALQELRRGTARSRTLLRRIQPNIVAMRTRETERYRRQGLIAPVIDGVGEWLGQYDPVRGISGEDLSIERLVV